MDRPVRSGGDDALLEGLMVLCKLHDRPASPAELTAGLPLKNGRITLDLIERAAARVSVQAKVRRGRDLTSIAPAFLPVLLVMRDDTICVLTNVGTQECTVIYPEFTPREHRISTPELVTAHTGVVVYAAPMARNDNRAGDAGSEPDGHWFWSQLARFKWNFVEIGCAAALANTLALATALYSRQIYDRVVPNLSFPTLWVLTVGVGIAIIIEAIVRVTRGHLMDIAGKRIDLEISSKLFERAMGMRLEARPKSTGSFINQIREFDSVRDFFTSTTIGAVSDVPFAILFICVIALIGGPVALVLVAAIPLIVIPGMISQWPFARYARMHLREGSIRNGLLVESMTSAETVKAVRAENRFQKLWEEYTSLIAINGNRTRNLTNMLTYWSSAINQGCYVMVVVVSVYQVARGNMTMGSMLACSILSSRAISPLTQLSGIFARWQNMRVALKGVDGIMKAPVDRPASRKFVHRPRLKGQFQFENLAFLYDRNSEAAIQVPRLGFKAGSATALLGANGSGKSTLLKILAGLYHPTRGSLLLDGTDIRQIDPANLRRLVGYLPQETRLFYGTLRDNLLLGLGEREDEELLEALLMTGAEGLARNHPQGLDRAIGEGGSGVSGGQRQAIGLTRIWLQDPRILLLDEPTAAIDHALERRVIINMQRWIKGRTLIVATHRQPVLALVDRAVVINRGRPVADGPVKDVLAALSNSKGEAKKT